MKIDNDALLRAVNKWEATAPVEILLNMKALREHMVQENGIRFGTWIGLTDPIVVDEKKYTMFLLRYS
jgi:hypothetical protein